MLERLTRTKRNVGLAIVAAVFLWFFWSVRAVLNPLLLGYLLAYIVHPLVLKLERRGWRRRSAVNFIFVSTALVMLLVGMGVFAQGRELTLRLAQSGLWDKVSERIDDTIQRASAWFPFEAEAERGEAESGADGAPGIDDAATPPGGPTEEPPAVEERTSLTALWRQLSGEQQAKAGKVAVSGASEALQLLQIWVGSLLALVTVLVLLPIYTYFLLFELERIHRFVRRYLPVHQRERLTRIGHQVGEVLSNFFRGRLFVCFLKGALLSVGLVIVGVPYALLLGMTSGFLALVPFVGPFLGFVLTILVGLIDPEVAFLGLLVRTGLVFGIGELVEGYVLVPKILGDSLGLHPVVVLVSVFVGGAALGMFGFLIALPLTAAAVILVREFVLPALADFADEGARAVKTPAPSPSKETGA